MPLTNHKTLSLATLATTTLLLAACSNDEPAPAEKPSNSSASSRVIELYSRATGPGETNVSADLYLWKEQDYLKLFPLTNDGSAVAYGSFPNIISGSQGLLNDEIDDHRAETWNPVVTGLTYPDELTYVYASGLAPAGVYTSDPVEPNFEAYTIAEEYQTGLIDFLASNNDGSCRGAAYSEQEDADGTTHAAKEDYFTLTARTQESLAHNTERELKFRHLTAAISINAVREASMNDRIGIKRVKVTAINQKATDGNPYLAIPTSIRRWTTVDNATTTITNNLNGKIVPQNTWTYVVDGVRTDVAEMMVTNFTDNYDGNLVMDETNSIGTFYVLSPNIAYSKATTGNISAGAFNPLRTYLYAEGDPNDKPYLRLKVEYTLFYYQDSNAPEKTVETELEVDSWEIPEGSEAVPTGANYLPGFYYNVTLRFSNDAVALRAELVPWDTKGPYYYSVVGGAEDEEED
ncbi:MAG: hypothetical protein LIO90_08030 [Bacteroidales bacterium]|nr:hypothetical protein [Bacteroidales bacterium]